jgi:hypothetical protein
MRDRKGDDGVYVEPVDRSLYPLYWIKISSSTKAPQVSSLSVDCPKAMKEIKISGFSATTSCLDEHAAGTAYHHLEYRLERNEEFWFFDMVVANSSELYSHDPKFKDKDRAEWEKKRDERITLFSQLLSTFRFLK